jgi:hypothetical protein
MIHVVLLSAKSQHGRSSRRADLRSRSGRFALFDIFGNALQCRSAAYRTSCR